MNLHHLRAISRKEFRHILRDPGTLLALTLGPVFLLVMLVYMMTADVRDAPVAVVDNTNNARSAELVKRLDETKEIRIAEKLDAASQADALFDRNQLRATIIIPEGYGEFSLLSLARGFPQIEITIDGTEPTSAEQVLEAAYTVVEGHMRETAGEAFANVPGFDAALLALPVNVEVERRYNPDLRAVVDFYPGLAAMVLSLPGIALALAVAREHEIGTMEQLVAMPVSKLALLVGKLMPYLTFGMASVVVLLLMARVLYDVPFRGNVLGYLVLSFFFLFSNMGLGLLISVFLHSQQVAMIVAFLVFFVPGFFLSGIFFPISAMPQVVQLELQMLPITHYVAVSKAMYLQGAPISALPLNTAALIGLSVAIIAASVALFRKKVA